MTRGGLLAAGVMAALVDCKSKPAAPRLKLDGGIASPEIDAAPRPADAAVAAAPPHATQIVVGAHASCAVLSDRSVRCWGEGGDGELGDGAGKDSATPVAPSVQGVKQLVLGEAYACAQLDDGSVACWGKIGFAPTAHGKLLVPTAVAGVTNVHALFAQGAAACATDANNALVCWGDVDAAGRITSTGAHRPPTAVRGLARVVALTPHGALDDDRAVWSWATGGAPTRTPIAGAVELGERDGLVCGRRDDGSVACVGDGPCMAKAPPPPPAGGKPSKASAKKPAKLVKGKPPAAAAAPPTTAATPTILALPAASRLAFDAGTCVVTSGHVQCLDATCKTSTMLAGLAKVDTVAGSCALSSDGIVRCWHADGGARTVVAIRGADHATALAAMGERACAIVAAGVACWTGSAAATVIGLP
jgi:hypothetical protein